MSSSTRKRGRFSQNTPASTATDQVPSSASKRQKFNAAGVAGIADANGTASTTRTADSSTSKPTRGPGLVKGLRNRSWDGGNGQGAEESDSEELNNEQPEQEDFDRDGVVEAESGYREGSRVARISTSSSPAKLVLPPSATKAEGRPAGKLSRVKRFATRPDTTDDREESSLSVETDRSKCRRRQSAKILNPQAEQKIQPKRNLAADEPKARSKKNVEFEIGKPDNLEGFKDLPDTTVITKKHANTPRKGILRDIEGKARPRSPIPKKTRNHAKKKAAKVPLKPPVQEDSDSEDEDDVPCAMCQGRESKKPNEIVFCETCNLAVHQECYDIPVIPESDWFCRACLLAEAKGDKLNDHGGPQSIVDDIETDTTYALPTQRQANGIKNLERHFCVLQWLLLQKLTGQRRLKLKGLDDEYKKVHQVVEQTVLAGESNSMLLIGARGSGKTTLIETVLSALSATHREKFHIVRLNGFIHTDDKLALREIWRQLGREMEVDEDLVGKTNNHADTLASLLALLSHPSELSETDPSQTSKSVIFVLDEFDLFATHPRQTLLYNLFDIAQARKAPIAVLGLTTRIDVMESLEKRVKSRFSHRYVHLSLPRSLPAFWDVCREGLSADDDEIQALSPEVDLTGWHKFQRYWDAMLETLYTQDQAFKQHLLAHFYRSKSIPSFLTACLLPLTTLTPSTLPLTGTSFLPPPHATISLGPPDSKLHLISSLPSLPLTLLIAAARLDIIHDTDACNFAMAYAEYQALAARHKLHTSTHHSPATAAGVGVSVSGTKIWGRDVALGAWERLAECGLLVSAAAGAGAGTGAGAEGKATKMWKVDAGLEEIGGCVEGLAEVFARWCREI